MIKVKFGIFMLILSIIISNYSHAKVPEINHKPPIIEIKSSKEVYLESEPVWLEIEVNIDKEMELDKPPIITPLGDVEFILINSHVDTIKYFKGGYSQIGPNKYLEHYYRIYDILNIYGVKEDFPNSQLVGCYKLLPDKYTLKAILNLSIDGKVEKFNSNLIQFEVEIPRDSEEEEHKKMIEIKNYAVNGPKDFDSRFDIIVQKVNEFKMMFPNSVYIDRIISLIFRHGHIISKDFQDTVSNYLKNRLEANPADYFNYTYVSHLWGISKNNSDLLINTLTQISESNKGTLLQKIIDNYLAEAEARKLFKQ
jgi:hypothetical protein